MGATIGQQIHRLRQSRGWTLGELARRAGTSAPTLHRYESGWDRFEVGTLRKIAAALGARLDVRLVSAPSARSFGRKRSPKSLVRLLSPLFWDKPLREADLRRHPEWAIGRVLMFGSREQVAGAASFFGEEAIRRSVRRRGIDRRTRNYWETILGRDTDAS